MKSKAAILSGLFFLYFSFGLTAQSKDIFIQKLTAINPTSYTDVAYMGVKDTVIVSTFSGRIAVRINSITQERVIANLDDEIYSVAYNPLTKEIAASTLENGIILVHQITGKRLRALKLKTTWSTNILYSDDFRYLFTQDQKGNRYLWDAKKDYKEIIISTKAPAGRMVKLDKDGLLTIASSKKIIVWDLKNETVVKETNVQLSRFGDMDIEGNYLSVDYNECAKYNSTTKQNDFVLKHPNWLRDLKDYPNYENWIKESPEKYTEDGLYITKDYSMQLTMVRFAKNKIYTASIDRSIRVWDKETGNLLRSLTGHKATVNKIKVNTDQSQLVSIDLKGGIKFWEINSN